MALLCSTLSCFPLPYRMPQKITILFFCDIDRMSEYQNFLKLLADNIPYEDKGIAKAVEHFTMLNPSKPFKVLRRPDSTNYNVLKYDAEIGDGKKIINIEVSRLNKRLVDKNYKINFDKTVINRIYELNSQEEYGARPLKRIIQNLCEDFLSEEILKGTILENVQYTLKYKDENLTITKKTVNFETK